MENVHTLEMIVGRLERLKVSRAHYVILIIAALSLAFDTLDTVLSGFVLAALRTSWNFSVTWIGIISAIGISGYLVGSLVGGFFADRYGRKTVILYTLVLASLFSFSRGFVNNIPSLIVLNFFTWLFVGAESSVVPVYLSEIWPSVSRGKLSGWMMAFFALGISASPIWAVSIIPAFGWRWAFWGTAPFALLAGFLRKYIPESPRWLAKKGRFEDADREVRKLEDAVAKQHGQLAPVTKVNDVPVVNFNVSAILGPKYLKRTLMLWCAWFAEYGVLYAFLTFVPTLLIMSGHKVVSSFAYSVVIYLAYIPGYIFGGYLVDILDRKWGIVACFVSTAIFGTLFGSVEVDALTILFGALTAFSVACGSTCIYTYTPENYPTDIRATGMGIASAWGRVGSITLLLLFGVFAVLKGKLFLFLIADALLLVAAAVVAAVGISTKYKSLEVAAGETGDALRGNDS